MTQTNNFYAVIMAGGGGTRLWPLSRKTSPKPMLSLVEDRTLFQTAVQRLNGLIPPENIYVVTVVDQAKKLMEQCPEIPQENYLLETMPRGTASVVGLAAIAIKNRDPDGVMAVLTADHIIRNEIKFHRLLMSAYATAKDGNLVTLGIEPTFPATGYGYIQQGELLNEYEGLKVYSAEEFKEKPDDETAKQMLDDGTYTWNSGMFVWGVQEIWREFSRQMPDLFDILSEICEFWASPERVSTIDRLWKTITPQTIDYGIMENAENVAVIPASNLGWNDVGSWDSLFDVLPTDEDGNIVVGGGQHVSVDTHNSLVYMNQDRRLIVTIGVDDVIVVDTGDVVLVCDKSQAQKVRDVVKLLNQGKHEYL